MAFVGKRAQRSQAKARLGLCGPSGSGKTMSALRVAAGIARALGREGDDTAIALLDTERSSANLYAHVVPFTHVEFPPPYSVERYQDAIEYLESLGCVVGIIDQISHAWAGPGGLLEYVDEQKARSSANRNQIQAWATATPKQNAFVDSMLRCKIHLIATMRSKTEWVMEEVVENGRKRTVPRKLGLAPIQRDQIEYEFTTFLNLDADTHHAVASKDRTELFKGQMMLDERVGETLAKWILGGAPLAEPEPHLLDKNMSPAHKAELWSDCQRTAKALELNAEALWKETLQDLGINGKSELKDGHYRAVLSALQKPLTDRLDSHPGEEPF